MNYLKSVLAALFVGCLAYAIAVVAWVSKDARAGRASGVGNWLGIMLSTPTMGIGLLFFVLALLLFLRK